MLAKWHSWSSNGRWLVFSSKANTAYTQLFLTHIDANGESTPPVVLERFTVAAPAPRNSATPLNVCAGSTDPTDPVDPTDPTDPGTPPARKPPRGLHASWTEDPHSTRTLTWFTDGSEDPGSIIEYGPVIAGMTAADIAGTPLPHRAEGAAHATYGVDALTHIATARGPPAELAAAKQHQCSANLRCFWFSHAYR